MIYLASPYTSPSSSVMEMRYRMVAKVCADMLRTGEIVYSPIVHCHELAKFHDLPRDFEFWQHYNFGMLEHADELQVLMLDGWEASKGLQGELRFANKKDIPFRMLEFF